MEFFYRLIVIWERLSKINCLLMTTAQGNNTEMGLFNLTMLFQLQSLIFHS
jgi:hypothetical protein